MKKLIFLCTFLVLLFFKGVAQNNFIDSLKHQLDISPADTNKVKSLINLAWTYTFINPDSAISFAKEARDLARELNYSKGEGVALNALGEASHTAGDFPQALEVLFNALRIGRATKDQEIESNSLDFIGIAYVDLGEYRQGLNYLYQAKEMNEKFSLSSNKQMESFRFSNIGYAYEKLGNPDSALFFQQQAQILSKNISIGPLTALILTRLGVIQADLGNHTQALNHYMDAIYIGDILNVGIAQYRLAELFYTLHQPDSSLHYARLAFINNQRAMEKQWMLETSNLLVKLYKAKSNIDSSYHYQEVSIVLNDSLFGPRKFHSLQLLAIREQQRQQEILQEQQRYKNKIKTYLMLAALVVFLLLAFIFWRNNRNKQRANTLLQQQKQKLEGTLQELKSTQRQLIQSEKMASLGELAAGIAHEIQNPLNFVNNFSEVNKELIEEVKSEKLKDKSERDESLEGKLLNDIAQNLDKISHHGRRADAIVKGMLQHSRSGGGQRESVDINALCDEYLRLAYHGSRAKDKSFNAEIKTDFESSIGNINTVPQDVGRVVLNLINNAFYAVSERMKLHAASFKPQVLVSTKRVDNKILISVKDNGNGIPQNIIDKIFQPFFTTKPTGHGTGLGLSLAYDIVKAHGGEIKVETKEGEGSEFVVQLPISS